MGKIGRFRVFLNGGGRTPFNFFLINSLLGIVGEIGFGSERVFLSKSFDVGRRGPPDRVWVSVVCVASCV